MRSASSLFISADGFKLNRFLCAVLIPLILYSCGREGESKQGAPKPATGVKEVKVMPFPLQPIAGTIEFVGTLSAFQKAFVATEMGGMVERLFFERGMWVKKEQILAEIGTRTMHIEVQQVAAARDVAENHWKKSMTGSRPEEIHIARAAVEHAQAALRESENNFLRIKGLHGDKAISSKDYDSAKRNMETALANLEAAKQQLELTRKGPRIEDKEAARATLDQSLAAMAMAEDRLRKSIIRSPCDGQIAFRKIEEGEVVGPGTVITQVVDNHRMKIQFSLGERYLSCLDQQQKYLFTVDAIPNEVFTGVLTFLSPTADQATRCFPLELSVENPDKRMADGMTVRIKFPVVEQKETMKVPSAWLSEEGGRLGLLAAENGRAVFKPVTLGSYYDHRVEILSGLTEGVVVITNPAGIKSGDELKVE